MTQLTTTDLAADLKADLKATLKADLATEILGFSFFDAPENALAGDGQYDPPSCARVLGLHERHSADIVDNLLDEALADEAFIGALVGDDWPLVREQLTKIAVKVAELFTVAYKSNYEQSNRCWGNGFVAAYFGTKSMDEPMDVLEAARGLHADGVITTLDVVYMPYDDLLATWLVHTYANPLPYANPLRPDTPSNTGWLAKHLGNTCRGVLNTHEIKKLITCANTNPTGHPTGA